MRIRIALATAVAVILIPIVLLLTVFSGSPSASAPANDRHKAIGHYRAETRTVRPMSHAQYEKAAKLAAFYQAVHNSQLAAFYQAVSNSQQAAFYLERVLRAFPNSRHAETAQTRLSQIQGGPTRSVDLKK